VTSETPGKVFDISQDNISVIKWGLKPQVQDYIGKEGSQSWRHRQISVKNPLRLPLTFCLLWWSISILGNCNTCVKEELKTSSQWNTKD